MSWDVLVFHFRGSPPRAMEDLPEGWTPDPLGSHHAVQDAIARQLPGVDWTDPEWGHYVGDGFSIEFNVGQRDPIVSIMLHVRGGGDPITTMLRFATPNKWSLVDGSTGDLIDPDRPSYDSWERFQAFRDKVIGRADIEGGE